MYGGSSFSASLQEHTVHLADVVVEGEEMFKEYVWGWCYCKLRSLVRVDLFGQCHVNVVGN